MTVADESPKKNRPSDGKNAVPQSEYTEKKWFERAEGAEKDAGGNFKLENGEQVRLRVFDRVSIKLRENGVWRKQDDGKVATVGNNSLLQFEATSPNCDSIHWIQFYNEKHLDANGKQVGGSHVADRIARDAGKWYIDAPAAADNARPDANAAYYDNPSADSVYARNKTSLSIFDRGNGSDIMDNRAVKKGVVSYRTYLVANGKVRWVVTWQQVTTRGLKGELVVANEDFKGRSANKFDKEQDTPRWDVGMPTEDLPNGKTIVLPPVTLPNPLMQR